MVLSRAIVSDKCDPVASAKVFSQLMLVMGLAPILAPMLGGVLVNVAGWQSIFLALSLFSAGCLLAVSLGLPESLPSTYRGNRCLAPCANTCVCSLTGCSSAMP